MSRDDRTLEVADTPDADDAAGAELGRQMADLVSGVEVTPALRARVAEGVMARRRPRVTAVAGRPMAAAAAVVVLIAGALAVAGGTGGEADDLVVADERPQPSPPTTVAEDDAEWPATVGGVVIVRPPGVDEEPPPPPVTEPAPAPQVAPPPTVPPCRDSLDPACGPFTWDPAPVVPQAELRFLLPGEPARVGVPYEFVVEVTDPGTLPTLECFNVHANPPARSDGVQTSGCAMANPECPARYGAWTPPPPQGGTIRVTDSITFEEPGMYTIAASTRAPTDRCENVDPYGTDASAEVVIEVVA